VTPTACAPSLSLNVPLVNIVPGGSSTLTVFNNAGCATTFTATPQNATWLDVSGGGAIAPSGTATINLHVDETELPSAPGVYTAEVLVAWSGGSITATVQTTKAAPPNNPPVILRASGTCPIRGGTPSWVVEAADNDGSVVSVVVRYTDNDGGQQQVALANTGGPTWAVTAGSGASGGSNFQATATDNLGLSTSAPVVTSGCE
jgi:hypothetical protein